MVDEVAWGEVPSETEKYRLLQQRDDGFTSLALYSRLHEDLLGVRGIVARVGIEQVPDDGGLAAYFRLNFGWGDMFRGIDRRQFLKTGLFTAAAMVASAPAALPGPSKSFATPRDVAKDVVRIKHPPGYKAERQYIYHVIFREFFGLDYVTELTEDPIVHISFGDPKGAELLLPDVLFQSVAEKWLAADSLPRLPLCRWTLPSTLCGSQTLFPSVPVIYGRVETGDYYEETPLRSYLGIDVFGSAFFMLTHYEQVVKNVRDRHDRYPAAASLPFEEGFLERPIINEYVEILWCALSRIFPGLQRKPRNARVLLTHDLDRLCSSAGQNWLEQTKTVMGDLILRGDPRLGLDRLRAGLRSDRFDSCDDDPGNTFDFIMDLSEKYGRRSTFYFLAEQTAEPRDNNTYSLDDPWVRQLMRKINTRGHEIGLHPTYHSYCDPLRMERELSRLKEVAEREDVHQSEWGSRQHYLRWKSPITWQILADVGLAYDSTVSYPECVGFASGVCYEHSLFNVRTRRQINLKERPLIAGDHQLLEYMKLDFNAAVQKILDLNSLCKALNGDFVLLWHNSRLVSAAEQRSYREICDGL